MCLGHTWAVGTVCWPSLARFGGLEKKEGFLEELSGLSSPSQKQQQPELGLWSSEQGKGHLS